MCKGQSGRGLKGSGEVLKHCFWTCSFSWSPPNSRRGQTGEDGGQSPCIHRGGPSLVYRNFPGSLRNLSICREVSSHSDLSSRRELPPSHLAAPHHTKGLQGCIQQRLQAQVSPGDPRSPFNPKTLFSSFHPDMSSCPGHGLQLRGQISDLISILGTLKQHTN